MAESRVFFLRHAQARQAVADFAMRAPDGWRVKFTEPTRTLEQNDAQWPILEAFSRQKQWPVNGEMCWMGPEDWKDVLTAAFKRERVRLAQGLDGGVVMLGTRTSKMKKPEFSEWLDFLNATAALRGVDLEREVTT